MVKSPTCVLPDGQKGLCGNALAHIAHAATQAQPARLRTTALTENIIRVLQLLKQPITTYKKKKNNYKKS